MPRITIPPMPTCVGAPCPAVTFDASRRALLGVAQACERIVLRDLYVSDGLCVAIQDVMASYGFCEDYASVAHVAIGKSLNRWAYLCSYLGHNNGARRGPIDDIDSIRREWAGHIAHFLLDALEE